MKAKEKISVKKKIDGAWRFTAIDPFEIETETKTTLGQEITKAHEEIKLLKEEIKKTRKWQKDTNELLNKIISELRKGE